jgi:hypothetical protein
MGACGPSFEARKSAHLRMTGALIRGLPDSATKFNPSPWEKD